MAIVGNNTAGRALPNIGLFGSQSWTPAFSMQAYVYVIGGGGSGAASDDNTNRSGGGGAAGCAISFLTLLSSVTYTVTIGAGGVQKTPDNAGANGGNSSLSGSNIATMTANGGIGGAQSTNSAITGAAGGAASGGTICNNTGGAGGDVPNTGGMLSGGGAVGIWGTGNKAESGGYTGYTSYLGGSLNYPNGFFTGGTDYGTAAREATAPPPVLAPFEVLSTFSSLTYESANYRRDTTQLQVTAGHGGYAYGQGSSYGTSVSGPFCGGNGFYGASNIKGTAGGGGLGAGGGAVFGNSSSKSGGGGYGAVLIFPVDMG